MTGLSHGLMQTATVLTKNSETIVGSEIGVDGYNTITFYLDYANGDETTLLLTPYFMALTGGTAYSDQSWSAAAGAKTVTENSYTATATSGLIITIDVTGHEYIKLMQTADNTGTPTGTLAARYVLKRS